MARVARLDFTWVLKVIAEDGDLARTPTPAISRTQLETPEAGKATPVNRGLGNMRNPHLNRLCGTEDRGR